VCTRKGITKKEEKVKMRLTEKEKARLRKKVYDRVRYILKKTDSGEIAFPKENNYPVRKWEMDLTIDRGARRRKNKSSKQT
jgi:CRISPR/Cas system CMR-associated protein Cmr3 (group 5 of RAMP superfamily)